MTDYFRIHDTAFSVWYDKVDEDRSLATLKALCAVLEQRGWTIGSDPRVDKNYKSIARFHRRGRRGDLEMIASAMGRHIEVKFFQNVANVENPHGGEHDYDRLRKMPYLLRLRTQYDLAGLSRACMELGLVDETEPAIKTPMERARGHRRSWEKHFQYRDPSQYDATDGDGAIMADGDIRYWRGYDGHLRRGPVFYNLNSMWVLVAHDHAHQLNRGSLFSFDPTKHHARRDMSSIAKSRIQSALKEAIADERFEKAAILRDVRNRMVEAAGGPVKR